MPGDIVRIEWDDPLAEHLHGTEQLVLFCTSLGGGRGKQKDLDACHAAIVKLVDPDTLEPYPPDSFEIRVELNMFVHKNVEVLELVVPSRHRGGAVVDSSKLDQDDPMLKRMSALQDTNDQEANLFGGLTNGREGSNHQR